jgi:hypothetical protein
LPIEQQLALILKDVYEFKNKEIDPLNADGVNLHEFMMQNVRLLIGETN